MKRDILGRYERTEDGKVIVDVSVGRIEDMYNYFDRTAPYLKKDLDPELVDYLIDCVREIGKADFILRVGLSGMPDEGGMERVKQSIHNYFLYLLGFEGRRIRTMLRTSCILFAVGVSILALSIIVNRSVASSPGVVFRVFAEGLTVAAWVSLWEALATFLIQWPPLSREMGIYRRIAHAKVVFRQLRQNGSITGGDRN